MVSISLLLLPQAQSIPILLKGMDVIGLAKTGSGKTASFVLPMVPHIMDQPELRKGDGPVHDAILLTSDLSLCQLIISDCVS